MTPAIRANIRRPTIRSNEAAGLDSTFRAPDGSADAGLKLSERSAARGHRQREGAPHPPIVPGLVVIAGDCALALGIAHHESELGCMLREPHARRRRRP